MTRPQQTTIKHEQLLTIANNCLYKCFFETSREKAKRLFTDINKGKQPSLLTLETNKGNELDCHLALDSSEFVGRFNYSAFRSALTMLIQHIADKLKKEENLNVFTNEQTGAIIFHIPGIAETNKQLNVLVLGSEQPQPGMVLFKLQFLDPNQFLAKDDDNQQQG